MSTEFLLGAFAKTEWAKTEIENLNTVFCEFLATNPYERRSRLNADQAQEIWHFKLIKKFPPVFQVRAGNILANLREPLDNMVAALSQMHRGVETGVQFPFGTDVKKYEAEIQKLEKLLPSGAAALIRAAQTHPGGNVHLRALHYLKRDGRHRASGLVPINAVTTFTMSAFRLFSGQVIRLGFERGSRLIPDGHGNLVAPDPISAPAIVRNGVLIRGSDGQAAFLFTPDIDSGDDDMEYLVVSPGTQFECDAKPVLDIAFGNIPGLGREPAIVALKEISQLVESILLTFHNRFFI